MSSFMIDLFFSQKMKLTTIKVQNKINIIVEGKEWVNERSSLCGV